MREQALARRGAGAGEPGDRGGGQDRADLLDDRARAQLEHEPGREGSREKASEAAAVPGADREDHAGEQTADENSLHAAIITLAAGTDGAVRCNGLKDLKIKAISPWEPILPPS